MKTLKDYSDEELSAEMTRRSVAHFAPVAAALTCRANLGSVAKELPPTPGTDRVHGKEQG